MRLAAKAARGPNRRMPAKRKGHRLPEVLAGLERHRAEDRVRRVRSDLEDRRVRRGDFFGLCNSFVRGHGQAPGVGPHKPCAHSLNSPLTKPGLKGSTLLRCSEVPLDGVQMGVAQKPRSSLETSTSPCLQREQARLRCPRRDSERYFQSWCGRAGFARRVDNLSVCR